MRGEWGFLRSPPKFFRCRTDVISSSQLALDMGLSAESAEGTRAFSRARPDLVGALPKLVLVQI